MTITLSRNWQAFLIALVAAFLFDRIVFTSIPGGLVFLTAQLIVSGALFIGAQVFRRRLPQAWYFGTAVAILSTIGFFVTSSPDALFLGANAFFLGNLLAALAFLNNANIPSSLLGVISWFVINPCMKLIQGCISYFSAIGRFWLRLSNTARAAIIAAPVTCILLLLLAAADPIISQGIAQLFDRLNISVAMFVLHLFAVACIANGLFWFFLSQQAPDGPVPHHDREARSTVAWHVTILAVALPLALFAVSQLMAAFFARDFAALGISYSDYAYRGVFEACMAALLSLSVLFLAWGRRNPAHEKQLEAPSIFLLLSAIGVMAGATAKVLRYVNEFGFTPMRIIGILGVLSVALIVVLCGFLLMTKRSVKAPLLATGTIIILFFALTPLMQIDALSMRLNAARASEEEPLDVELITELSAEAVPSFLTAVESGVPLAGISDEIICADEGDTKETRAERDQRVLHSRITHKLETLHGRAVAERDTFHMSLPDLRLRTIELEDRPGYTKFADYTPCCPGGVCPDEWDSLIPVDDGNFNW